MLWRLAANRWRWSSLEAPLIVLNRTSGRDDGQSQRLIASLAENRCSGKARRHSRRLNGRPTACRPQLVRADDFFMRLGPVGGFWASPIIPCVRFREACAVPSDSLRNSFEPPPSTSAATMTYQTLKQPPLERFGTGSFGTSATKRSTFNFASLSGCMFSMGQCNRSTHHSRPSCADSQD